MLGIIGGMGPAATALFFEKIIVNTDAKADKDHIRIFMDNNISIPDRTSAIIAGNDSPVHQIIDSARKLIQIGADILCFPCNTSHYFYDEIQSNISVPIVHMVRETAVTCLERGYNKVGILCTDGTRIAKVYDSEFRKVGIVVKYPDMNGQREVMNVIYNQVKSGNKIAIKKLIQHIDNLRADGIDAIILACTELSLAFQDVFIEISIVDSLEVLAKSCICLCGYKIKE